MGMLRGSFARIYGNTPSRFAVAIVVTAFVLLIAHAFNATANVSIAYLVELAAVAFLSRYCGIWPSIASAALTVCGVYFWFLAPTHLLYTRTAEWLNTVAFLLAAILVVAIGEAGRTEAIGLRNAAGELEEKVQERTAELDRSNQSLRELTAHLMNLQDEERRRIARELHDNAGQALAALAINLDTVAQDIQQVVKTAGRVADSASIVQQMSADIRTMSYLLHPPLLDDMGLESALKWYVDGFTERSKIAVELKCDEDLGRLSRETETAVFRIVQECLTNIHRHSGSSTATIRIMQRDDQLCIDVADHGKGIAPEAKEQMESGGTPGVGVRGMRERVRQLGGRLEVHSDGIGTGTRISMRLPVTDSTSVTQLGS